MQITTVDEPLEGNVCRIVDFNGCICMGTHARPVLHFELVSVIVIYYLMKFRDMKMYRVHFGPLRPV